MKDGTVLCILAIWAFAAGAEATDCTAHQPIGFRAVLDCCAIAKPNYESLPEDCKGLKEDAADKFHACKSECVFKSMNAIVGYELQLPSVRIAVDKMFKDAPPFADAYYKSYEQCAPIIKSEVEKFIASGNHDKTKHLHKCSPLPMVYTGCAHSKMLVNCPADAWRGGEKCEASRAYLNDCTPEILERQRKKWDDMADGKTSGMPDYDTKK